MVKSSATAREATTAACARTAARLAPQTPQALEPLPPLVRLGHAALVITGWLLFAWSWQRVTVARSELGEPRGLVLGALAVVPLITLGWVAHNVGIHRRKGPRRAVPEVEMAYAADFNGRRIEADWSRLVDARHIDIVIHADAKRFVAPERKPECKAARLEEVA